MASTTSSVVARVDTMRTLDFNSIGAAFVGIGLACTSPVRSILIINNTDVMLWFSFDGINSHFPLDSASQIIFDIAENNGREEGYFFADDSKLYVKRFGVPTVGSVYVTLVYGVTA